MSGRGQRAKTRCIQLAAEIRNHLFELEADDEVNCKKLMCLESQLATIEATASEMIPTKDGLPLAREERSFRKPVAPELPTYTFRKVQAKGSVGAERDYIKRYTINTILEASQDPAK